MRPAALAILVCACGGRTELGVAQMGTDGSVTITDAAGDGAPPVGPCPSIDGLLAYYPLDQDTKDHSGHGFDAVATNLAASPGILDGAFTFDGASSSLHVTGSANFGGPRTLCAWARPNPTSGLGQPLFWGGVTNSGDFFSIFATSPSGGTCPKLLPGVPFVDHWGGPTCFESPALVADVGQWSFVCFAFDGALSIFVDGQGAPVGGTLFDYSLDTVYIGSTNAAGTTTSHAFDGALDEVTLWSRALDPTDIQKLWNGGAGCTAR